MSIIKNPWDLGKEEESKPKIPNFVKASYIVTRVAPPKGKTVRDGLVMSAAMINYTDAEGNVVEMTSVTEDNGKLKVEFPNGKYAISATKYRGPKSYYRFLDPDTNKFKLIPQESFTVDYAKAYLASSIQNWTELSEMEQNVMIDEYFEDLYMFGMSNDFALDGSNAVITPGIVTDFYRRYTPPVAGKQYGNVIITKWPSKSNLDESSFPALTGDFEVKSLDIVNAITDELYKPKVSTDEDMPF